MIKFLKDLLIIIGLLCAHFAFFFVYNQKEFENTIIDLEEVHTLILGDSHAEYGLNPQLIPNSKNYSQPSETYLNSYLKLEWLTRKNNIETLILPISYNNLSGYNDLKYIDEKWSYEMFSRMHFLLNPWRKDFSFSFDKYAFLKTFLKQRLLYKSSNYTPFLGEYHFITDSLAHEDATKIINTHFYKNEKQSFALSQNNLSALDSIITFCQEKNIDLHLVSIPLYDSYIKSVPSKYIHALDSLLTKFGALKSVHVYNFTNEYRYNKKYFFDPSHLNKSGADHFSSIISRSINSH